MPRKKKKNGPVASSLAYSRQQQQGGGQQARPTPKPVLRQIKWTVPPSVVYGKVLTVADLKASATGEGGDLALDFPQGELQVGQTGPNLRLRAPGKPGVTLDAEVVGTVAVTPAPRSIVYTKPSMPLVVGTALTAALFEARPSAGPGDVTVSKPTVDAPGKQTITLGLAASGNYGPATAPVEIDAVLPERTLTWLPPPGVVFGAAVALEGVGAVAGDGPPLRLEFPLGPLAVGQGADNLRLVAPGQPGVSRDAVRTATVVVTPAPRTATFTAPTEANPVRLGQTLTAATFSASASVGTQAPVVLAPPGGAVAARGPLDVTLGFPADPNYADTPVTFSVTVQKGQPEIVWKNPAALLLVLQPAPDPRPRNYRPRRIATIGATQLNAVTKPAGVGPLQYRMAIDDKWVDADGQVLDRPGQFFLKVRFAGNDDYLPAEKEVRLLTVENANIKAGADAMGSRTAIDAAWGGKPTNPAAQRVFQNWDDDEGGMQTQAKEVIAAVQTMTDKEIVKYCDGLENVRHQMQGDDHMWLLPNGLQLRLKPEGDGRHTLSKMFSVEAVKGAGFSSGLKDVAFKITPEGEPAPKAPLEAYAPATMSEAAASDFHQGVAQATHMKCQPMQPNEITWALKDGDAVPRGVDVSHLLNATALDGAATSYKYGRMDLKQLRINLPPERNAKLSVRTEPTDKYKETVVTRTIDLVAS